VLCITWQRRGSSVEWQRRRQRMARSDYVEVLRAYAIAKSSLRLLRLPETTVRIAVPQTGHSRAAFEVVVTRRTRDGAGEVVGYREVSGWGGWAAKTELISVRPTG